jgi:deazaflavin-dependent oxidoreductase (nitroreductase family)
MTNKVGFTERLAVWMEVEIMSRLTPRDHVGPVFKWIFKIPLLYYKLGLGGLIGKRFLLLTTTGRKSGKPRHTPLEYVHDPQADSYRVSPGWGGKTDWYRNLLHDPIVSVQVGRRKFSARAEPVPQDDVAESLMKVSQRHPSMDRIWARWSDHPMDGTPESYRYAARFFPAVRLRPD